MTSISEDNLPLVIILLLPSCSFIFLLRLPVFWLLTPPPPQDYSCPDTISASHIIILSLYPSSTSTQRLWNLNQSVSFEHWTLLFLYNPPAIHPTMDLTVLLSKLQTWEQSDSEPSYYTEPFWFWKCLHFYSLLSPFVLFPRVPV